MKQGALVPDQIMEDMIISWNSWNFIW